MSPISVRLFGAPRLEQDDKPLPLGRSKALALLAYLCLSGGPHAREALLDLLWPFFAPADARNNLRRELSLLRGLLPGEMILADRQSIAIDATAFVDGRLVVDVCAFDRQIEWTRSHEHAGSLLCPTCAAALESAATLYTQDFLAGFTLPDSPAFDEWQFQQGERLRYSLGWALEQLANWHYAEGAIEQALGHARRWTALDPLNEQAHRLVMRLLADSGRQAAALRQFETLRRVLQEEFGDRAAGFARKSNGPQPADTTSPVEPEPETVQLYEAIRGHRSQSAAIEAMPSSVSRRERKETAIPTNLPVDTTPFIGRRRELAQLHQLLTDPATRLITIVGIGGIGKTRLAMAAARHMLEASDGSLVPDGVFFVPLAPLTQAAQLPGALALGIGFTPGGDGNSAQQVIAYLKSRQALLFIDNVEHLITDENIAFIRDLMESAPGLRVLLTSRMRVGLGSEQIFPLDGLGVGAGGHSNAASLAAPPDETVADAILLFAEAARRVQPSFALDHSNREIIARICSLVEGMPLAIELAAGWVDLLTPDAILDEIKRSLDFLASPHTDTPLRQSNLKAVFDSSWRLLTPDDQGALICLSVFPGNFNREAAEAIAGAPVRTLLSLRNKSWLQSVGPNRYQIHPLLRQYAAREAAARQVIDQLRDRHAAYFAALLSAQDEGMKGRHPYTAFDTVAADLDNIRAAMMWFIGNNRLEPVAHQMAQPLFRYLESRLHYFLFEPLLTEAVRRSTTQGNKRVAGILLMMQAAFFFSGYPTRLLDYYWVGSEVPESMQTAWESVPSDSPPDFWHILLAWQYGRFVDDHTAADRLVTLIDRLSGTAHHWNRAFAHQSLGRILSRRSTIAVEIDPPIGDARTHLTFALKLFETLGDEREAAITTFFLGLERQAAGKPGEARALLLMAQERFKVLGETIIAAGLNWQLGEIYMQLGETDNALHSFHEMAEALIRQGRLQMAVAGLSRESYETVRYGDVTHALRLREQCLALSRRSGDPFIEAWDYWEMGETYRVMGQFEQARHWFELSRKWFQDNDNYAGTSFYYRGLADVALAEGQLVIAEDYYREAVEWAERTGHPWQQCYALSGLALTNLAAERLADAKAHLIEALHLLRNTHEAGGLALMVIVRVGRLCLKLGGWERAAELARLALSHSLTWNETRREAQRLLEQVHGEQFTSRETTVIDLSMTLAALITELSGHQPSAATETLL